MSLSKYKIFTSRTVYDFFAFLCDLGGFNGTIMILVSTLIKSLYTAKVFYYKIVSELYLIVIKKQKYSSNLTPSVVSKVREKMHILG